MSQIQAPSPTPPVNPPLSHFVRVDDGDLPAALCTALIALYHERQHEQERNGRGHRAGLEDSAWTEFNLTRHATPALLQALRERVDAALARYNAATGLSMPVPSSAKLADFILKRYQPGGSERFQLHFDSIYAVSNRYLVFLWYLNAVPAGGETVFPDLELAVQPAAGRLLMFPPYWMFQHAGEPPGGGDKYIVSTYLLF